MKTITQLTVVIASLIVLTANVSFANVGQVIDVNTKEATATVTDTQTREIVRFEDVDPTLKVNNGCVVDYYNPTEQEARKGATATINEVLECPR